MICSSFASRINGTLPENPLSLTLSSSLPLVENLVRLRAASRDRRDRRHLRRLVDRSDPHRIEVLLEKELQIHFCEFHKFLVFLYPLQKLAVEPTAHRLSLRTLLRVARPHLAESVGPRHFGSNAPAVFSLVGMAQPVIPVRSRPGRSQFLPERPREHPAEAWEEIAAEKPSYDERERRN